MTHSHFFLPAPAARLTVEQRRAFEQLVEAAPAADGRVAYNCPYPKFDFLFYLARRKHYLLHGSPHTDVAAFRPVRPTAALEHTVAVYATDHELSALFAAVRPNQRLTISGYFWAMDDFGALNTFYDFTFTAGGSTLSTWTHGMVYVLPRAAFEPWGSEWASKGAVTPLLKLPVSPEDFPFFAEIQQYEARHTGGALGGFRVPAGRPRPATAPGV